MRQMEGLKFRRQQPIDNYITDFVCFEKRLIIEIDGGQHAENKKDIERDNYLSRNRFKVLRFWNSDVFTNIEGVLEVIRTNCLKTPSPAPPPVTKSRCFKQGRGKHKEHPQECLKNLNYILFFAQVIC